MAAGIFDKVGLEYFNLILQLSDLQCRWDS